MPGPVSSLEYVHMMLNDLKAYWAPFIISLRTSYTVLNLPVGRMDIPLYVQYRSPLLFCESITSPTHCNFLLVFPLHPGWSPHQGPTLPTFSVLSPMLTQRIWHPCPRLTLPLWMHMWAPPHTAFNSFVYKLCASFWVPNTEMTKWFISRSLNALLCAVFEMFWAT